MTQPESEDRDPTPSDRFAEIAGSFLSEPMLWPVGIVVLLCFASFLAAVLSNALRGALPALAALALLLLVSFRVIHLDIRARRWRGPGAFMAALWLAGIALAFALTAMGAL